MKYAGNQQYARSKHPIAEGFANGVSNALMGLAKTLEERQHRQQDEQIIEQMNNPELTEMERAQLSLKLSKDGQRAVLTAMELYRKIAHEQAAQARHQEELDIRREREGRLKGQNDAKDLDSLYKTELKSLQDQINDIPLERDKKPLKDKRTALQKERALNVNRVNKGLEPVLDYLTYGKERPVEAKRQGFDTMNQMGGNPNANIPGATPGIINPNAENSTTSFTPNAPQNASRNATNLRQQQPQVQQGGAAPIQPQQKRVRWDKNNPEHVALAARIYKETGNDRAKTNAVLSEQFER